MGICTTVCIIYYMIFNFQPFDSAGRLHHEAGAVSGRPPVGHRRCGNRSGLSAGKENMSSDGCWEKQYTILQ